MGLTITELVKEIVNLKNNPILMNELSKNIKTMEYKNASNVISAHALNLIKK